MVEVGEVALEAEEVGLEPEGCRTGLVMVEE